MNQNQGKTPTRVVIYVRGGLVQDILTDASDVQAMVVDYDNERAGDDPANRVFEPVRVDPEYIEKTIKGIED